VVRVALGVIWIWAAWEKLRSPRQFVQAVRAYDATPEWLSKAIGYGLPVLEFSIGVLLIIGVAVRLAAIVSAVLFVVFLVGVIQAAARGLKLDCGCFGGGGTTQGATHYTLDILRDVGLLALSVYLIIWPFTQASIEAYMSRHDRVEAPSAKRMRSDQGRRKYNAMLEARRKAARERAMWMTASIGTVIVLIALIGIGVQSGRAKISGSTTATHATVSSGVVFGKKAAATVDLYEDYQCPNCLNFQKAVGAQLEADVRANKAQVRFHPIAILDSSSNHNYSTRAANAALCASDVSVDAFVKYSDVLWANQPPESGSGRTDKQLEGYAAKAGITGAKQTTFVTCVQTQQHKSLVQAMTDAASKKGVNATPTVLVNGKSITPDLASWNKAIADALKKGPAPNPSKTPSPSASSSAPSTSSAPAGSPSTSASSSKKG
jgi:protein-disulfide isomerase